MVFASEKICVDEISEFTSFGDLVCDAFLKGVGLGLTRNLFCVVLIKEGSKVTWWDVVTSMIGMHAYLHAYLHFFRPYLISTLHTISNLMIHILLINCPNEKMKSLFTNFFQQCT